MKRKETVLITKFRTVSNTLLSTGGVVKGLSINVIFSNKTPCHSSVLGRSSRDFRLKKYLLEVEGRDHIQTGVDKDSPETLVDVNIRLPT